MLVLLLLSLLERKISLWRWQPDTGQGWVTERCRFAARHPLPSPPPPPSQPKRPQPFSSLGGAETASVPWVSK